MSAVLKSETDKDNESTEEGKQTGYPTLARNVPNSRFCNSTSPNIPNLNGTPSFP